MPLENDIQKVKFEKWRYYCNILENAKHIVAELQDEDVYNERMEAFRVYNNSFIALLKHRYPYSLVHIDGTYQVVLEINKEKFYCDIKVLKKQLKKELFELIEYNESQVPEGFIDEETDFILKDLKSYKKDNSKENTNGPPNNESESVVLKKETPSYRDIPKEVVEYKRMVLSSPIVFAKANQNGVSGDNPNLKTETIQTKEKSPPDNTEETTLEVQDVDFEFISPKQNANRERVDDIEKDNYLTQDENFVINETNALLSEKMYTQPKSTSIDIEQQNALENIDDFGEEKPKELNFENRTISNEEPIASENEDMETPILQKNEGKEMFTEEIETSKEILEPILDDEVFETLDEIDYDDFDEDDNKEENSQEKSSFVKNEGGEDTGLGETVKNNLVQTLNTNNLSVSYISDKNEILKEQLFYDYHKVIIHEAETNQHKEIELWVYPKDIVQENTVSADIVVLSKYDNKYKAFISPEVGRKSVIVEYDKYELLVRASWKDNVFESSVFPSGDMMSNKIDIEKDCVMQRPSNTHQLYSHLILDVEGVRTHILPGTFSNTDNGMADVLIFTDEEPRQIVTPIATNVLDVTLNNVRKNVIAYWEGETLICDFQTRDT